MSLSELKNFDHLFSGCVSRRKPNIFKLFYKFEEIPNIYQLAAGMPNENLFPIGSIEARAVNQCSSSSMIDQLADLEIRPDQTSIDVAMQYGQAGGVPDMRDWINKFTKRTLPCRYAGGFRSIISCGSTDGWYKTLLVFSNEWLDHYPVEWRQGIIVEEFTYSLAVEAARVRGLNILPIKMDDQGLRPEYLEEQLAKWDMKKGKQPHLLYTVSIGQNPTGATAGLERRKQIYAVCQKYDIIIVEDEPYWFLQFDGKNNKCYLDVDTDGRVVRLDSFSKNFVPGARMGWITAQPDVAQKIFELAEEATQQPSGFTQLVMVNTLNKWGFDGWMRWLSDLRDEYKERRNTTVMALEPYTHLGDKLILDFKKPEAGMFVWINARFDNHPAADKLSVVELSRAFWTYNATHEQPVLITPGYFFAPSQADAEHMARFFRVSYAPSNKSDLAKEAAAFGKNSVEFWQISDVDELKKLGAKFPM